MSETNGNGHANLPIPCPHGLEYFPFQLTAIRYALERQHVLIADAMGLGKSIEAIGVINSLYPEPAERVNILIVCPASLKLNWKKELQRWLVCSRSIGIVSSHHFPRNEILICNYDLLKRYQQHLLERQFDLIIADEMHYVKNPQAQRSKAFQTLDAPRIIGLTGTPILNRPIELFALLSKLDPDGLGRSRSAYAKRYCAGTKGRWGWDESGASNLDELQERLRSRCMIRRLKEDVLPELPPKQHQIIELPPTSVAQNKLMREEQNIYAVHASRILTLHAARNAAQASSDVESYHAAVTALRSAQGHLFTDLQSVRHELAIAKVPYLIEHIGDSLDAGPVVCFTHHRDIAETIANAFAHRSVLYTGQTPLWERQAQVERFQSGKPENNIDLFVGTIRAAGSGITLTRSSHVIFGEQDWVPGIVAQAEDRVHRIGTLNSVLIQHIVFDGSLDATIAKTICSKARVIAQAMGDDKTSEEMIII